MPVFFLAIAAGFLTILAPCILPVLPILLGGGAGRSRWRPVAIVLGFVGTFSVVGAALATAGSFAGLSNQTLRYVAVVVLLLLGGALIFEGAYEKLMAQVQPALARLGTRVSSGAVSQGNAWSGLLVGVSLGLIWTPCAGPILGAILTLAVKTKDFTTTLLLLLAYAVGAGVPMLAIAYGGRAIHSRLARVGRLQPVLNKVFGLVIILAALAIATGYDLVLLTRAINYFPVLVPKL